MICIINCGFSRVKYIESNFLDLNYNSEIIDMNKIKKSNLEKFSHIIISGRPTLLTQEHNTELIELFSFIKNINIPVFGICFGHQIIGLVYGSTIQKGAMIEKNENIEITTKDKLFHNIENNSLFQESHSEYISLPEDFILLAKSKSCENECMKHKEKKIYSTQFHPEVSDEHGRLLLENFLLA